MLVVMRVLGGRPDRVRTDAIAAELGCPLLVIHGRADRIVPFAHARRIVDAAPDAEMACFEDADHLQSLSSDPRRYAQTVADWLARAVNPQAAGLTPPARLSSDVTHPPGQRDG
jgi:pimeloyl-ACP methyl ester carboxylesterase